MNSDNKSGISEIAASSGTSVPMNRAIFEHRAGQILELIAQMRKSHGFDEAINTVHERFVDGEGHPELRRFGEVMALARRQAVLQERLDDDREQLHHGNLSHDELVSVGNHYEMMRHQACTYNHLLRGFIESCSQYFSREDLMQWMTSASQGRGQWAKGEVTGAVSEIALHAAMQGMPELRELRYATVEEDLVGYDFVATWQGKLLTVDSKTGFYAPLSERKHGHRHLEVSVPREAIKDFRITRRGLDLLRYEVRKALQTEVGVDVHAAHAPFRRLSAVTG